MKMTLAQAKRHAGILGFTLSKRDGEYRLAPIGKTPAIAEAQAYYSDDMADVLATARALNWDNRGGIRPLTSRTFTTKAYPVD